MKQTTHLSIKSSVNPTRSIDQQVVTDSSTIVYSTALTRCHINSDISSSKPMEIIFPLDNVILLAIMNIMMCLCHQDNTCNKDRFKDAMPIKGDIDSEVKKIINNILNIDGIRQFNTTAEITDETDENKKE